MHELGIDATGELVRMLGGPLTGRLVIAFGDRLTADVVLQLGPEFTGRPRVWPGGSLPKAASLQTPQCHVAFLKCPAQCTRLQQLTS